MKLLVMAGFLGAGKTSLLLRVARNLADAGQKVAIIENEIGKVGVDDKFIADQGLSVREIYGGCVCCSLAVSLLTTLKMLEEQVQPDVVIVEPSGVAGPESVRRSVAGYRGDLTRTTIVVIFDAERFKALSVVAGPFVEESIRAADLLVVNKTDLVPGDQVASLIDRLYQLNPGARTLAVSAATGKNLPRLEEALRDLIGGQPDRVPADAVVEPEQNEGHGDAHHHHPGEPIGEARECSLRFSQPRDADDIADQVAAIVRQTAASIRDTNNAVIGHVKCLLQAEQNSSLLIRTTSADRPPSRDGRLPDQVSALSITLNAIAYNIPRDTLVNIANEAAGSILALDSDTGHPVG